MLFTLVLVLHVLVCLILIASVLVQQGKGASMGAAFGTAGSQTVFGSSGAGNFLTKTTSVCAMIFFATSLLLAYRSSFHRSVIDMTEPEASAPAPKAPEGDTTPPPAAQAPAPATGAASPASAAAPVKATAPAAPVPANAAPTKAPAPAAP